MATDLVSVVNLVFDILILAAGLWMYTKSKNTMPFYIGVAFAFFSVSYIITLAGLATVLALPIVVIRAAGYLLILFGLLYGRAAGAAAAPAKKKK